MWTITSVFPLPVSGNAVGCLTGATRQSATLGGQTSCCLSRRAIRLSLSARQTPFWRKRQTAQTWMGIDDETRMSAPRNFGFSYGYNHNGTVQNNNLLRRLGLGFDLSEGFLAESSVPFPSDMIAIGD